MKNYSGGIDWASLDAWIKGGRYGNHRGVANNTDAIGMYGDAATIGIRLHSTTVVEVHKNGSYTLVTNGWDTVTTTDRINRFSPARVYRKNGIPCVWHDSDPLTPPNIKKCGQCHGRQTIQEDNWEKVPCADAALEYCYVRDSLPNSNCEGHYVKNGVNTKTCYRCDGMGTRDYGSQPDPIVFRDGITVNSDGKVMYQKKEIRYSQRARVAARRAAAAEAERKRQIKKATIKSDGTTLWYKAVDGKFESIYVNGGLRYYLGRTVTAASFDPDPERGCSDGINFCAKLDDAMGWAKNQESHVVLLQIPKGETIIKSTSNKYRTLTAKVVGIIPANEAWAV